MNTMPTMSITGDSIIASSPSPSSSGTSSAASSSASSTSLASVESRLREFARQELLMQSQTQQHLVLSDNAASMSSSITSTNAATSISSAPPNAATTLVGGPIPSLLPSTVSFSFQTEANLHSRPFHPMNAMSVTSFSPPPPQQQIQQHQHEIEFARHEAALRHARERLQTIANTEWKESSAPTATPSAIPSEQQWRFVLPYPNLASLALSESQQQQLLHTATSTQHHLSHPLVDAPHHQLKPRSTNRTATNGAKAPRCTFGSSRSSSSSSSSDSSTTSTQRSSSTKKVSSIASTPRSTSLSSSSSASSMSSSSTSTVASSSSNSASQTPRLHNDLTTAAHSTSIPPPPSSESQFQDWAEQTKILLERNITLQKKNKELTHKNTQLHTELQTSIQQSNEYKSQLDASEQKQKTLSSTLTSLKTQLKTSQDSLSFQITKALHTQECSFLNEKNKMKFEYDAKVEQQEKYIAELKHKLKTEQLVGQSLQGKYEALVQERSMMQEKETSVDASSAASIASLTSENTSLRTLVDQLHSSLDSTTLQLHHTNTKLVQMQQHQQQQQLQPLRQQPPHEEDKNELQEKLRLIEFQLYEARIMNEELMDRMNSQPQTQSSSYNPHSNRTNSHQQQQPHLHPSLIESDAKTAHSHSETNLKRSEDTNRYSKPRSVRFVDEEFPVKDSMSTVQLQQHLLPAVSSMTTSSDSFLSPPPSSQHRAASASLSALQAKLKALTREY